MEVMQTKEDFFMEVKKAKWLKFISAIAIFVVMIFCTGLNVHAEDVKDGILVTVSSDKENYNSEDEVNLKITVKNTNDFEVSDIKVENILPDGISLVSGDISKDNINLKANEESTMNLTVKKADSGQADITDNTTNNVSAVGKSDTSSSSNGKIPNTGENDTPFIALIVMLISTVIMIVCFWKGRKKHLKFLSLFVCLGVVGTFGITGITHAILKNNNSFTYKYTYKIDNADYVHQVVVSYNLSESSSDDDNIGEIYFKPTPEENISSNDSDSIKYANNEILIVAVNGATKEQIEEIAKKYNAKIVGYIEATGDYQLLLNGTYSLDELRTIAENLEKETLIESANINYIFNVSEDTINYGDKWRSDLKNFNDCKGKSWGIEAIGVTGAWDLLEITHKNDINPVRVGLIDTGFDNNHEDLEFEELFYNISPDDHGTHVAGTMAAISDNNEGICGVYPYGKGNLYGVKRSGVSSYSENGDFRQTSMSLKISYAELILRNVKVINSSLGFNYNKKENWNGQIFPNSGSIWEERVKFLESNSNLLGDFLNRLLNKGYDFVIINSAGNDSNRNNNMIYDSKYNWWTTVIDEKTYPEVYKRIIVVGSVDNKYQISNFSNGGDRVDIYAPGEKIYSTVSNNKYDYKNGTSMASPHVAGVCAMVWTANNRLSGSDVKDIICSSQNMRCTSYNMIDAYTAVEMAFNKKYQDLNNKDDEKNGGILCWVVNKNNEDEKIEGAIITATNIETGESHITETDSYGHFELFLPAGNYTLAVTATGYEDYTYSGIIEVKNESVNYLDDWIKMTKLKGAISGTIVDEFGNPIENANITIKQTLSNTLVNKKATTDSTGYFKIECSSGNYKIEVNAEGYEKYEGDNIINVETDIETILDTIQLKKSEDNLKEKVISESNGNIVAWVYEDFDGNGTKEAFAVTDNGAEDAPKIQSIYFIDNKGNTKEMRNTFDYPAYDDSKYTICQGKGFFSVDVFGSGSAWKTYLFSVKDNNAYELDISGDLQGFYERNGYFYTLDNNHGNQALEYPEIELIYNSDTQQFTKGQRTLIELKNYLGTSLLSFIENENGMYDVGATSAVEYKNDYLIVSASMLSKDIIDFFEITNNCNYSIHGVYYGMSMEEASNMLLQSSIKLSEDLPNYKYFDMNDGTRVSIRAENEKIVNICIWASDID